MNLVELASRTLELVGLFLFVTLSLVSSHTVFKYSIFEVNAAEDLSVVRLNFIQHSTQVTTSQPKPESSI